MKDMRAGQKERTSSRDSAQSRQVKLIMDSSSVSLIEVDSQFKFTPEIRTYVDPHFNWCLGCVVLRRFVSTP